MSAALKPTPEAPLIRLRDLHVKFESRDRTVHAVNGVDLDLAAGEVLCILGESGSGKSVTLRALMKLLPKTAKVTGEIQVAGRDVQAMSERQLADFRGGDVAMIFQEPMTALDPVFTIGRQIAETVQRHEGASRSAADARALELLELVQIPSAKRRLSAYPHELSGGLRQRAMIAVALACRPKLLLADEPTTALDATVQIQVLLLLRSLQEQLGMGVVFVTHDLGVAGEIADRVAVMYAGKVVEEGPVGALMAGPLHPYAKGLLGATVHAGMRGKRLTTIPGAPPMLDKVPEGCAFAPRCAEVTDACHAGVPALRQIVAGRQARCIRVAPNEGQPHI
ncbi:MAG: ABC transporter ATP-binding protein [Roseomonas sp.]|nr:ABC transporter ATP-binding protein [Roseomonas sp.]MCA3329127.1 ABC transporter ATP-binding protein [Roseomonas sp.]MCA3332016.1 ABC transporter ATP-binding protein [Roseomonas sp.]MCA3334664.1 ABC transporter ATP-binding protein [Roseomonas sp.]MCA3348893.1 ABC transporter ATP-binding protein [Roseomonas sp.]